MSATTEIAPRASLPPTFDSIEEERLYRKQRLAGALRVFGKFGFSEGVAGHITARDPELTDHFWVNPFAMSFRHIRVSDLLLVGPDGTVVEGVYNNAYIYVRTSGEVVISRGYWITKTNDLLTAAYYDFDANGILIQK